MKTVPLRCLNLPRRDIFCLSYPSPCAVCLKYDGAATASLRQSLLDRGGLALQREITTDEQIMKDIFSKHAGRSVRHVSTLRLAFDNTNPNTDRPAGGLNGHCRRRWSISAFRPCRPRRCRSTGRSAWSRKSAWLRDRRGIPTTPFSRPACTAPSLTLASRCVYRAFGYAKVLRIDRGIEPVPCGISQRWMYTIQRARLYLAKKLYPEGTK